MKDAPFARHADDADMNEELKARERYGDPMLAYLKKQKSNGRGEGRGGGRPRCPHRAPPNRFGIQPGYRWDGVVRCPLVWRVMRSQLVPLSRPWSWIAPSHHPSDGYAWRLRRAGTDKRMGGQAPAPGQGEGSCFRSGLQVVR
jgi:hypothetical protein